MSFRITVEHVKPAENIGRIAAILSWHGFYVHTEKRVERDHAYTAIVSSDQEGWSSPAIAHAVSAVAAIEDRTLDEVLESVRDQAQRLQDKYKNAQSADSTE